LKLHETTYLIKAGAFPESRAWREAEEEIRAAAACVDWPDGSGRFVLNPVPTGNGVVPVKKNCIRKLEADDWELEEYGDLDAVKTLADGRLLAMEWETGNVSSSYRALHKMALKVMKGAFIGGVLVLPVRATAKYLTDRVGNFEELRTYFELYEHLRPEEGLLALIPFEHDDLDPNVPLIPKGKDGNAKKVKK
jgi:hypothetical protein